MALMAASLWAGAALSWSLAAPPGPGNALMAQETAHRGLAVGWAVGLGAISADLTMLTLTWLGLLRVLDALPWLHVALGLAGAALMAYFALGAWRSARGPVAVTAITASGFAPGGVRDMGSGFVRGYALVGTSPFNLAWWVTAGTLMIQETGGWGVAGFFVGLLLWVAVWNVVAREGARRVKRFAHGVAYASAVILVAFSLIMLVVVGGMARGLIAAA